MTIPTFATSWRIFLPDRIARLRQGIPPGCRRQDTLADSETTRKRLKALNQYDIELYEWVKERFAKQIEPLEPNFSREVRLFEMLNCSFRLILRLTPRSIHARMKHLLLSPHEMQS